MKKFLFYITLFIGSVGFSQENPVSISTDTTSIRIGEQIQYKITVKDTDQVVFPELKLDSLRKVEVIEAVAIDTLKNRLEKKYILTSFDSGNYVIPSQEILIRNEKFTTKSLLINVIPVQVDTLKQGMFNIKSIQSEPKTFDDYKHLLWWVLLAIALIAVALYFLLKKKKEKEAFVFVAPIQEALERLKALDEKELLKKHKVKAYYTELTDIVRTYIEKDIKIPALESTTHELIETIEDVNESSALNISKETIVELKSVLQSADLVKFAKSEPDVSEIKGDRKSIEHVLTATQEAMEAKREAEAKAEGIKISEESEVIPEATSKVPMLKKYVWIFAVLIVIIVGLIGYIGYTIIGDANDAPSNEIVANNWIASSYGFPPVGIETPEALEVASTQLPEGSIAVVGDYVNFTNGNLGDDFYVSVSAVKFLAPLDEYDLDKAIEGTKTELENAANLTFRKSDQDVVFVDGLEGRELESNVRIETEKGTASYKLRAQVFADVYGMRQVVVAHKTSNKEGVNMSERIFNSIKLK